MKKLKMRDLIKPQGNSQEGLDKKLVDFKNMVVPYCASGYSSTSGGTACASGYKSNPWCTSKPASEDEVLL
ncbi:hypothetical protein [Niabella sp.]|uniref:hypothetical protein n=1 Tax=Niabella sp. TaxID=1962976 RepID=UPI00262A4A36|nr:hypothetical protein [Niabella sp.]